jgi:hypothetical protein
MSLSNISQEIGCSEVSIAYPQSCQSHAGVVSLLAHVFHSDTFQIIIHQSFFHLQLTNFNADSVKINHREINGHGHVP